jgi:hypothetical protein
VAQRFLERRREEGWEYLPITELTVAAAVVAGFSVLLRIAIPLIPALLEYGASGLQNVFVQFTEWWPGIIIPFVCTISLGLLCSYIGRLNWSWFNFAAVGALGNGVAFMAAALLESWLLPDQLLAYLDPENARAIIVFNSGVIGAVIGAIGLPAFNKSERQRERIAELRLPESMTYDPVRGRLHHLRRSTVQRRR